MERSELSRRMAEATEQLRGLCDLQARVLESVRQIQDVMMFVGHPDAVELDDELDILYRGQL
ncbi:hypothetical protein [Streptomyces sp. NPDC058202]|jgi:hypothetical protein|uniref:hypothetical protein n=1 Tax=Streptomyces sp. NPDC058202 TaxID=3346380 RepID=UPI0036E4A3C4